MAGYIKRWNTDKIVSDLQQCYFVATDPRQDGFTTWPCKQDLYFVKFALDEMLARCSDYGNIEREWLEEIEKRKVWKALNEKTNR
jgi:hypothetical protein